MKTPNVLIPALRQYRHNQQEIYGYLAGFDYMLTITEFNKLESELEKLRADNARMLDALEIIACRKQPIDNTMSNHKIANACLDEILK